MNNKVLLALTIVAGLALFVAGSLIYNNKTTEKRAPIAATPTHASVTVAPPAQTTYTPPITQPAQPMFYTPQVVGCPNCGGSGYFVCSSCSGNGFVICPDCGGRGVTGYEADIYIGSSGRANVYGRYIQCSRCGGTGLAACSSCGGTGKIVCTYCGGRGSIITKGLSSTPMSSGNVIPCPDCGATGKVKDYSSPTGWRDCTRCWGSGWCFAH